MDHAANLVNYEISHQNIKWNSGDETHPITESPGH